MAASRIFSRLAELLDVNVTRAAAVWLRLNADGTTSQRTSAETLGDLGAASTSDLAGKASLTGATFTGAINTNGATLWTVEGGSITAGDIGENYGINVGPMITLLGEEGKISASEGEFFNLYATAIEATDTITATNFVGPGTGLTGTAPNLTAGAANSLAGILPVVSGGTGASNLDALQPKIASANASVTRTALGLGGEQSVTFAGISGATLTVSGDADFQSGNGIYIKSIQIFQSGTTAILRSGGGFQIAGTSGAQGAPLIFQTRGRLVPNADGDFSFRNSANNANGALTVSNLTASGSIESTAATAGVVLKSPDGTRYRITVANGGALTTTAL